MIGLAAGGRGLANCPSDTPCSCLAESLVSLVVQTLFTAWPYSRRGGYRVIGGLCEWGGGRAIAERNPVSRRLFVWRLYHNSTGDNFL